MNWKIRLERLQQKGVAPLIVQPVTHAGVWKDERLLRMSGEKSTGQRFSVRLETECQLVNCCVFAPFVARALRAGLCVCFALTRRRGGL